MHKVKAKGILSATNGMNIYRGCQHGCIYCDARSKCYQMNHRFEDIEVKENAPELLENALKRKRRKCMIGTGAMSDPYIPVLQMTLTTADESLCRIIEPNVSVTKERFETLKAFHENGIPCVVWFSPFLPFINDTKENIDGLLKYCIDAKVRGIICFGIGLTLRDGDREYFYSRLDKHFPNMKERYIYTYGNSYQLTSSNNNVLMNRISEVCRNHGIMFGVENVFSYLHKFESKTEQLSLFDGI